LQDLSRWLRASRDDRPAGAEGEHATVLNLQAKGSVDSAQIDPLRIRDRGNLLSNQRALRSGGYPKGLGKTEAVLLADCADIDARDRRRTSRGQQWKLTLAHCCRREVERLSNVIVLERRMLDQDLTNSHPVGHHRDD
jgi:hypothetical protein